MGPIEKHYIVENNSTIHTIRAFYQPSLNSMEVLYRNGDRKIIEEKEEIKQFLESAIETYAIDTNLANSILTGVELLDCEIGGILAGYKIMTSKDIPWNKILPYKPENKSAEYHVIETGDFSEGYGKLPVEIMGDFN